MWEETPLCVLCWGEGVGRFDFQEFCLKSEYCSRGLNQLILHKKDLKEVSDLKLKTVWMQNGQFYYIKS